MMKAAFLASWVLLAPDIVLCSAAHADAQSQGDQAPKLHSLMQIGRVSQPISDAFEDPLATLEDEFDESDLSSNRNKQTLVDIFPSINDAYNVDGPLRPTWLPDPVMCSLAACCIVAFIWFTSATFRIDQKTIAQAKQTLQACQQFGSVALHDRHKAPKLGGFSKDANKGKWHDESTAGVACASSSDSEEDLAHASSSESEAEEVKPASLATCAPELRSALTSSTQRRAPEDSHVHGRLDHWQTVNQRLATAFEDTAGCSRLHMAVAENLPCATKRLLEQKADVNATDAWEETPLHFAARLNGSAEVCAHLLQHGADINAVNSDGDTPVLLAARAGHAAACELLLARGGGVAGAVDDAALPPLLVRLLAQRVMAVAG